MSDNPNLTAIGDEPIEARIVAWVLGDASAFEAAELERLCDERPELQVFRRRMRALHGLLTEAEAAEPDTAWQLPPEKRKVLDELFGTPEPIAIPIAIAKRRRRFPHWGLSILAACVLLMLVPVALLSQMGGCSKPMEKSAMVMESPMMVNYSASADRAEPSLGMPELKESVRKQEDTVAQAGKVVEMMSRRASRAADTTGAVDEFNRLESEKLQLEDMKNSLSKYSGDQLAAYAAGINVPDNEVGSVSKKYLEEKSAIDGLKRSGMGPEHPALRERIAKLDETKRQLDQGVESLKSTLSDKLAATNTDYQRSLASKLERQGDAVKKSAGSQDYVDAREAYEQEKDKLVELESKLQSEELAANLPQTMDRRFEREKKPLKVEYPHELIEGTPRPIILPGITPAPGTPPPPPPALAAAKSIQMQRQPQKPQPPAPALAATDKLTDHEKPAEPQPTAATAMGQNVDSSAWRKPSAGAAGEKVMVADSTSSVAIPVPEVTTGTIVLGDGDDFGADWGGVAGNTGKPDTSGPSQPARERVTRGLRSGDAAVNANSIDAILNGETTVDGLPVDRLAKVMPPVDAPGMPEADEKVAPPAPTAAPARPASGPVADILTSGSRFGLELTDGSKVAPDGGAAIGGGGAVAGRPLDREAWVEGRNQGAAAPAGPPAKMPTLADQPANGHLFDTNTPVPADGESQPAVQNELAKQLANAKGQSETPKFQTAVGAGVLTIPATADQQAQNIDTVRRNLYVAEGAYNLGKFDQAKVEYEKTLRVDPYNVAARKGLEKVAETKSRYYRAAYDHTRAEMLMEVDKAWEQAAPAESKPAQPQATVDIIREFDARRAGGQPADANAPAEESHYAMLPKSATPGQAPAFPVTPATPQAWAVQDEATKAKADVGLSVVAGVVNGGLKQDLSDLAEREMVRRQDTVVEADRFTTEARDYYANGDFQKAYESRSKALELLPDAPALKARRDAIRDSLGQTAVALAEQAASNGRADESRTWFSKALEWNPNNEVARKLQVIDPASETAAANEPYSTFSLSISDASFKTAQAALAKGERPDPASIRVEQFYNAVDYGDPAPGVSEPVAATVEQSAHPVVPGRNLVRVALRTGATGRSAAQPLQLTLLVDQSGSMAREDRKTAMTQALTQLAGLLGPNDRVTVVGFSLTARMLADGLAGDQAGKLPTLIHQAASEGGTNLESALVLAKQLAEARKIAGAQNRIVLFTDGAANLGNANPVQLAETVKAMRQQGLAFDVAGIGTSELNDRLLAELARHGNGRFYVVGATADANDGFARQLAGAFRPAAENVKVQVRFNPQRVGGYKLIGFEEHRLNKEDFRNDAVDAAELAAEEAGVALYQVEPLPTGTGELGEVSVRFRDAASGQMVERSWTIPYDSSAPAFDRAAPSQQLAGLAMMAAEKLRGGPLADAVDFSQFAAPRAIVKQSYPNNRRVAEVLEMVEGLR